MVLESSSSAGNAARPGASDKAFADMAQEFQALEPSVFRTTAAEAPPQPRQVDFIGERRSALALRGRQIREAGKEEKVARDRACRIC